MKKKTDIEQRTEKVIHILKHKYPAPECALVHRSPWELLVSTILSAQCTDKRVNMVTPGLFKKFPTVASFASLEQQTLEKEIQSTGFFRNKAKNIIACAKMLSNEFSEEIPQTLEQLTKLPGVGRKTASVILGAAFNKAEGIVVDTHVKRLAFRLGLTKHKVAEKVETDLMKIVPKKEWIEFSHLLILHGRERCKARKPDCSNCELTEICPENGV